MKTESDRTKILTPKFKLLLITRRRIFIILEVEEEEEQINLKKEKNICLLFIEQLSSIKRQQPQSTNTPYTCSCYFIFIPKGIQLISTFSLLRNFISYVRVVFFVQQCVHLYGDWLTYIIVEQLQPLIERTVCVDLFLDIDKFLRLLCAAGN